MALKFGPVILILAAFFSIFIGLILHSISIDELKYREPQVKKFDPSIVIDDKPDDLLWFLQVTDTHFSYLGSSDRRIDFEEFADKYIDFIKPDVVLITGDITDARKGGGRLFDSDQQIEEWKAYQTAITKTDAVNKTVWLDVRGNHDNFNVYRPRDPKVLYRRYSVQGRLHERNYMKIVEKGGKNYTFIGIDEVQTPGLKIPFNFIGIVEDQDLAELQQFKHWSTGNNSQYNIWFAHYPTSSVASSHDRLRNMIDGPYLCGHYHTIGNWVTKMHSTQQTGYVEVELGDWKHNRRIRLSAIDHQLFSLADFEFRQLPIALLTNPKSAEHMMPKYEPVERILKSTHLRVIAFSNETITSVTISLDSTPPASMIPKTKNLYVLPWEPKDYLTGLHKAQINVTDEAGKSQVYTQTFSLDNSHEEFSLLARFLIRTYFKVGVMTLFFFVVSACTLPMIILRLIAFSRQDTDKKPYLKRSLFYNLHLLSCVDTLFWPIVMIPIWLAIGPNFVGYLVDDALGVSFVWGVLIDGKFVHTGITFNVGSIFLLIVHIPTMMLLTSQTRACYESILATNAPESILNWRIIMWLLVSGIQLFIGSILFGAYGCCAYLTSFPTFWTLILYAYCWYQCTKLSKTDFAKLTPKGAQVQEEQPLTE